MKLLLSIVIASLLALLITSLFSYGQKQQPSQPVEKIIMPEIPPKLEATTQSQPSPDGKLSLVVHTKPLSETEHHQQLVVQTTNPNTENEEKPLTIFEQTMPTTTSMEIPYNTFSPNNIYFFVNQQTATGSSVLVFKSNGKPFDQSLFLNLTQDYQQGAYPFVINKVTGWAANGLLLLTTVDQQGEEGPSFWYDIASRHFIYLSTRF